VTAVATPRLVSKKPWELAIPRQSVSKVRANAERKHVQITVKKHKPRGILHFKSTDDAMQRVVEVIAARISR